MRYQYPNGEIVWVSHHVGGALKYIITSKPARDYYYIYELIDGKFKKLGKGRTPSVQEEKYIKE